MPSGHLLLPVLFTLFGNQLRYVWVSFFNSNTTDVKSASCCCTQVKTFLFVFSRFILLCCFMGCNSLLRLTPVFPVPLPSLSAVSEPPTAFPLSQSHWLPVLLHCLQERTVSSVSGFLEQLHLCCLHPFILWSCFLIAPRHILPVWLSTWSLWVYLCPAPGLSHSGIQLCQCPGYLHKASGSQALQSLGCPS